MLAGRVRSKVEKFSSELRQSIRGLDPRHRNELAVEPSPYSRECRKNKGLVDKIVLVPHSNFRLRTDKDYFDLNCTLQPMSSSRGRNPQHQSDDNDMRREQPSLTLSDARQRHGGSYSHGERAGQAVVTEH